MFPVHIALIIQFSSFTLFFEREVPSFKPEVTQIQKKKAGVSPMAPIVGPVVCLSVFLFIYLMLSFGFERNNNLFYL